VVSTLAIVGLGGN
jgi:hypothetical protein